MTTPVCRHGHPRQHEERQAARRERERDLGELAARAERGRKLARLERELEVRRALAGKGARTRVGRDAQGLPVYRWRAERKR